MSHLDTLALPDLSDDAFLGEALHVLQPRRGYRAGLDAVLLAASAQIPDGSRVLDVGAGVGVVALCVAHRCPSLEITLVERDPQLAELARRNVERNGLCARLRVIQADVSQPLASSPELLALAESFDWVLSNPPYHASAAGTAASDALKAASHAMPAGGLERWLQFMASMVRPSGTMGIVHKADALDEILFACRRRFGGLNVVPVHPRAEAMANRVIVSGTRGSRAPMKILPGVILHGEDGRFLPAIDAVLRQGDKL